MERPKSQPLTHLNTSIVRSPEQTAILQAQIFLKHHQLHLNKPLCDLKTDFTVDVEGILNVDASQALLYQSTNPRLYLYDIRCKYKQLSENEDIYKISPWDPASSEIILGYKTDSELILIDLIKHLNLSPSLFKEENLRPGAVLDPTTHQYQLVTFLYDKERIQIAQVVEGLFSIYK